MITDTETKPARNFFRGLLQSQTCRNLGKGINQRAERDFPGHPN